MLNVSSTAPTDKSFADGKILQAIAEGICTITFNNPEKRNAMSLEMWEGLGEALAHAKDAPDVRVVVLTGAGDKAFVSGADISQFEQHRHNAEASREYTRRASIAGQIMATFPKPTIARIRGFCIGGGMQVAMMADMRIAADGSQFGIPAAKLGIAYGFEGLNHLVSLVGPAWARLLLFTGMRIDAAEAQRIGLIERAVAPEKLDDAVMDIARTIARNAPLAISAAKITIGEILKDAAARDMDAIRQIGIACADSEDYREGRRAFMEKRAPEFRGR
jgi:enoyl-CoA hydratase/carnithine racemase